MRETGEMTDHIVGEIQCRQGDEMFEALKVIRVRELERSWQMLHFTVRRSILLL